MLAWGFAILAMWIIMCFIKNEFLDIPLGVGAVLGYIVGGKAIQSFAEREKKE